MTETILELTNLAKHYGQAVALDEINLAVKKGEFLTFLGPSGSGKTTTLNLIAGFTEPSSGHMTLGGKTLEKLSAHERGLGVVFQHYALFPHMTVAENIEYPLKQRKIPKNIRQKNVQNALEMVRLETYAQRYPRQLSGGQQQRVALARALVYNPPILLMDEPLGALDKKLREWLQLELRRIHRELGSTFIYVTHDQEEALVLSDRIAVFNEGRIEQIGTAHELYLNPKTLFVGKFIGESSVFKATVDNAGTHLADKKVDVPETSDVPRQGEVALLIRPEKLHVRTLDGQPFPSELTGCIQGTIEDTVFLGTHVKYNIHTGHGDAIARVTEDSTIKARPGDTIELAWHPGDASILPYSD